MAHVSPLLTALLAAIAAGFDQRVGRIPNRVLLPFAFAGIVCFAVEGRTVTCHMAGAAGFLILGFAIVFVKRKIGAGDGKLLGIFLLYLPDSAWVFFLFFSFLIALLAWLFERVVSGRKSKTVPLAPAMAAAVFLHLGGFY